MLYKVKLLSKDKHGMLFSTEADNEEQANKKALDKITELGYECYFYKIQETTAVNKIDLKQTI